MEVKELGINAGLQDRVIQVMGGLVYMDFSVDISKNKDRYIRLDPTLLPNMYLVYEAVPGSASGTYM